MHPDIWESYLAYTDPNYFKIGQLYKPIVSGFGGTGKNYKTLKLIEITPVYMKFIDINKVDDSYLCHLEEAYFSLVKSLKDGTK